MRTTTLLSILTIFFLLTPLACPLMATAKTEHSSHNSCPGDQQKQENQGVHACCDQQAVPVKSIVAESGNSVEMLPPSGSSATDFVVVQALQDFTHLHLKTGDLLAKLSVLRI